MPKPSWVDKLAAAIDDVFSQVGLTCDVEWEAVSGTRLIRIYVISKGFKNMRYTERQSLVWRIAKETLTDSQLVKLSMILTLTPSEYGDED